MSLVLKDRSGREVELDIGGRYQDDIQCEGAIYLDDGTSVPDHEVDWLMDKYASELYEEWYQLQVCAAEYYREGDR